MAKANDAGFFQVPRILMQCEAFRTMDAPSKAVLFEMMNAFTGFNNGFISMSHRQIADAAGLSRATADRSIKELMARGFIIRTWKGRRIDQTKKVASQWEITCYQKADAQNKIHKPTNDFMKWDGKPLNIDGIDMNAYIAIESEKIADEPMKAKVIAKSEPIDLPTSYEAMMQHDHDDYADIPF